MPFSKGTCYLVIDQQFDIGDQCLYARWSLLMWFMINMWLPVQILHFLFPGKCVTILFHFDFAVNLYLAVALRSPLGVLCPL